MSIQYATNFRTPWTSALPLALLTMKGKDVDNGNEQSNTIYVTMPKGLNNRDRKIHWVQKPPRKVTPQRRPFILFLWTHHKSPTFLIPATTRSLRRQNSTKISANLVGSSYDVRKSRCINVHNKERTAFGELKPWGVVRTSWIICPVPGTTTSWNLPWIWPIINSRSSRSVPASTNSRAVRAARKLLESPMNQPWEGQSLGSGLYKEHTLPVWSCGAKRGVPLVWMHGGIIALNNWWNGNSGRYRISNRIGRNAATNDVSVRTRTRKLGFWTALAASIGDGARF